MAILILISLPSLWLSKSCFPYNRADRWTFFSSRTGHMESSFYLHIQALYAVSFQSTWSFKRKRWGVKRKAMRRKSSVTASYNTAEEGRKVFFIAVKSSIMVFLKATEAKEARIHTPLWRKHRHNSSNRSNTWSSSPLGHSTGGGLFHC